MAIINFDKTEKEEIIQRIRQYFSSEMDQDLGQFQAGFLLTFFAEEIGPYFYNQGIRDAQAILQKRVEDITAAIDSLEKPTRARR